MRDKATRRRVGPARSFRRMLVTLMALGLLLSQASTMANGFGFGRTRTVLPDGYNGYLVYLMNGVVDLSTSDPVVPGCEFLFCDGDYFQRVVMGWDDDEIEDHRRAAGEFFFDRFGVDVTDPRVVFRSFTFDPRANYRVYSFAGKRVPSSGWVVRDGGWSVLFLTEFELGGEFAGVTAQPNEQLVFGNYNILETDRRGRPKREHVIFYRSGGVIGPNKNGDIAFRCELSRRDFATDPAAEVEGLAQGIAGPFVFLDKTNIQLNTRNVLTFSTNPAGPGL